MSEASKTAYITGGASGIGRAVATMLVSKGCRVFLADRDIAGASSFVSSLNSPSSPSSSASEAALAHHVEVTDWESQAAAFGAAVKAFGRVDYVFPIAGIGERVWTRNVQGGGEGFEKPDLSVLDVNVTGVLYTVSLAVQLFRRQEVVGGFRGKIGCVASICGFYCAPTIPIYTASKHAIVGLVRSYGKYLPEEHITINAVCPNVIRTNISTVAFYDDLEAKGLLTPMDGLIQAFESMLGSSDVSGETFEVGPNGGFAVRKGMEFLDRESEEVVGLIAERAHVLQEPVK